MANLTSAKMELTFKYPFFSSILLKRTIKERKEISAIQVSNDGIIYYNPEFTEKLSLNELVFVLAHEVMHYVCMHGIRRGSRNPEAWNEAGDLFINSFLISSHVGQAPDGIVSNPKYVNKTTEEIYSKLRQRPKNTKPLFSGEGKTSIFGSNAESCNGKDPEGESSENSPNVDPLSGDLLDEVPKLKLKEAKWNVRQNLILPVHKRLQKVGGRCPEPCLDWWIPYW